VAKDQRLPTLVFCLVNESREVRFGVRQGGLLHRTNMTRMPRRRQAPAACAHDPSGAPQGTARRSGARSSSRLMMSCARCAVSAVAARERAGLSERIEYVFTRRPRQACRHQRPPMEGLASYVRDTPPNDRRRHGDVPRPARAYDRPHDEALRTRGARTPACRRSTAGSRQGEKRQELDLLRRAQHSRR
jgi:hypothetical protein